jgi:hypothetical protein
MLQCRKPTVTIFTVAPVKFSQVPGSGDFLTFSGVAD